MKIYTQKHTFTITILLSLLFLSGCGVSKEEAREELAKLNINYSPSDFIKAADNNDIHVLELFLKSGISPNVKGDLGETALLQATKKENIEMIKMLTDFGADPTIQNVEGENALIHAIGKSSLNEALDVFLNNNKLDLNKTFFGYNIAMIAAESANKIAFEQIIDKKVNVKIKNESGESLLHSAVRGKDIDIIKKVLNMDINPNQADSNGVTPLAIAVNNGDTESVKLLLEKKADPKVPNVDGGQLLSVSISKGYDEITKELIKSGAEKTSLLALPLKENNKNVQIDKPFSKSSLLILKGDVNEPSSVTFKLGGKAKTLSFSFANGHGEKVGFFDSIYDTKFRITGDGKEIFSSDQFTFTSPPKAFSLNVLGVNNLTISSEFISSDNYFVDGKSIFTKPEIILLK
jgi:ankyrin repeat protein